MYITTFVYLVLKLITNCFVEMRYSYFDEIYSCRQKLLLHVIFFQYILCTVISHWNFDGFTLVYKKFWEELIAYFTLIRHGWHRKLRVQQFFVLCKSRSYVTTDGQSASLSWCQAPIWGSWPHIYYCLTITVLFLWGTLWREDGSVFCQSHCLK
jgi:hypothetical protein